MRSIKNNLILILIICFLFGVINRAVSERLYHTLSEQDYKQWFYNLIYFELFIYSLSLTIYAFLLKLCTITKIGIITSTSLTFLDLLSVALDVNFKIVESYSIIITVTSFVFICVEFFHELNKVSIKKVPDCD